MNTTDDIEQNDIEQNGVEQNGVEQNGVEQDMAVVRAQAGTAGWEDAVRLQRWAVLDHGDFYALAGEMVATLHALEDLAVVLGRQVAGYAHTQRERGRVVYDDTRQHDPRHRLAEAATDLDILADRVRSAERAANAFWSGIGHVGTKDQPGDGVDGAGVVTS
jgi:hypothetical protein